ncbi:MAG: glycoside hydrolase family 30 beta sandwich domain-containing protein [Candidatus Hodarchaeota archaeon]
MEDFELSGDKNSPREPSFKIFIDEKTKYQSILGLGYSFEHTSCYNLMKMKKENRRKVLELLVDPIKGAGMNLWRLCIGTPDFTYEFYTYDDLPEGDEDLELKHFSIEKDKECIIPVVKEAQEINPDLILFASPWSPPGWMKGSTKKMKGKKPRTDVDCKGMCGGRLLTKYYDVYSDYLIKFIKSYEDLGIPIYAITVQNEPGHNWYQMPTCKWTGEEERDFIKKFLGPKLEKEGLKTKIWCFDFNFGLLKRAQYPEIVLSDPDAAKFVDGVAFHGYDMNRPKFMGETHELFPSKEMHFTEGSVRWLWGASRVIDYFKNWSSSYVGWVPFIDTEGNPNIGPFKTTYTFIQFLAPEEKYPIESIIVHADYYYTAHFSKFIQKGAYRVKSTGKTPRGVSEVSFLNPDGTLVSIIVNRGRKGKMPAINWKNYSMSFNLPGRSIATFKWKNEK